MKSFEAPISDAARSAAAARRAALAAGVLVAVVGGGHLTAWLTGVMASAAGGTTITMKTNTSVCLVLAGFALALLASKRPLFAYRVAAGISAAVVLGIAAGTLAQHIGQFDLGIDQFLATEPPGAAGVMSPNRMGPPASFSFVLLGAALLLLSRRQPVPRFRTTHQPLALAALVVGLVPLIGYLYGTDQLYGIARLSGVAWPTAAALCVLAIGVLLARADEGPAAAMLANDAGGALIRRLLPATVLMPLFLGWLRLAGSRWLDPATGTSLLIAVFIVALSGMAIIAGRWVSRSEAQRRENQEATLRQLGEIQAIYDSAPVGLCVFNRDLRYLRVNRRLAEFHGIAAEDHVGKTVDDVMPSLAPLAHEVAERILRTGQGVTDVEFIRSNPSDPDSPRIWMEQWQPLKDLRGEIVAINVVVEDVTERRKTEEALRRSEERFRALVQASSEVLYRMSPDWSEMLALQGGDFLADTGEPNAHWLEEYIHPDDRKWVQEAIERAVRTGSVFALEHRVLRADGTLGWTSSRAVPVRDTDGGKVVGWFGAASDITERKRAEEALRRSESRLTAALEIAQLGIWEYDVSTARSHYDERCRQVFGISEDRPLSNDEVFALVHPDDRPRVQQQVATALDPSRGGVYETEYRIVRPDGTERWVAVRGHVTQHDGRVASSGPRFVGTVMDITDRRRAEELVRQANVDLAEADRHKDEFIAILSHELRNPLAPIRYALPLLEREPLGDPAARALAIIQRQVDHLTRLVDDVLDVSRITRGQIELRREDVTLDSIVKTAVEAASPTVAAGRHTLTTALPDAPIWLNVDPRRIAQALTNLLNNSAKYTPPGGRVRLEAEQQDGSAVIRVRDNGMGIEPKAMPSLFRMFHQVNRSDTPQGGLGIGLAFARRLVELHGGLIEAHSAGVGLGAEFVVRLPVAPEARASEVAATTVRSGGTPSRRLKVLVVDDSLDSVEMLTAALEATGHDVRTALDGRSAIAVALSYRPDVVLLDLGLPVIGGLEVARTLRQHAELAGVRLVALTGWGQAEDRRRTLEAGFDNHVTKPAPPERIQELLEQFASRPAKRGVTRE